MPHLSYDLTIIIVNWNTRQLLQGCLTSLHPVLASSHLTVEVIVVDNGSTDGSREMVAEQFPQVRLIANHENRLYAGANNQGIAAAKGRYLLLLNSDTIVNPGALEVMIRRLDANPKLAGVAPKLLNPDGTIQRSCWPFPLKAALGNAFGLYSLGVLDDYRSWDHRYDRLVDWLSSACLMVPRRVFDDVGLLDERFFYGVDVDWAHRAAKAGYRFMALADAEVVHLGKGSQRGVAVPFLTDGPTGGPLYFRTHYGGLGVLLFRTLLVIGSLPRWLVWEVIHRWKPSREANDRCAMLRYLVASALGLRGAR
ncbi:MAG TPA: glycosyltransferase family 2 protein [bacterium]|nr:glycosyltransferase family 2 protein [bacterium]